MKTRSKLRTKLSKASTKRSGCLLFSKQTKHKQKQNTQVSTPKVPSQRRSTPLEPNFHTETVSVALVGLDLSDRRPRKSARWCFLMLFQCSELLTCVHVCMVVWLRAGEASTSCVCPLRVIMSVTRSPLGVPAAAHLLLAGKAMAPSPHLSRCEQHYCFRWEFIRSRGACPSRGKFTRRIARHGLSDDPRANASSVGSCTEDHSDQLLTSVEAACDPCDNT